MFYGFRLYELFYRSFRNDYFSSFKNYTKDWYTAAKPASRLTCLDGEPQPRAGEKNGARKSEPARELLIFEFPAFADERSDPIGLN